MSNEQIDTADKNFLKRMDKFFAENWFPFAAGLFLFPLLCILLAVFGLIVAIPVTRWHLPVALGLTLLSLAKICQWNWKRWLFHGILFLGTVIVSCLVFSFALESAWDGLAHHKPPVYLMRNGWNPVWEFTPPAAPDSVTRDFPVDSWSVTWGKHYPKADWYLNAVFYAFSGNIDLGSASRLLQMIALFAISMVTLPVLFPMNRFFSCLFSLTLVLNPVTLSQMPSGYSDGLMGTLLTILFLSLTAYLKSRDGKLLPFIIGSIIITTNLKFTGVVYVGLFLLVVLIPAGIVGLWKKASVDFAIVKTLALSTVLALIVGINPYIHNIYGHLHPFYPLAVLKKGDVKSDILATWYSNEGFKKASHAQRFVLSHMVPIETLWVRQATYTVTANKIFTGQEVGDFHGFGEFFAIPLLFSLLAIPFLRGKYTWLLFLGIWATILIQPHSWWARYIPQLWIIPVIVLCSLISQSRPFPQLRYRVAILTCCMILFCLACSCQFGKKMVKNRYLPVRQYSAILSIDARGDRVYFDTENIPDVVYFGNYYSAFILDNMTSPRSGKPDHGYQVGKYLECPVYIEAKSLNDFLEQNRTKTMLIAVKDDAQTKLSEETKEFFRKVGGNLDKLAYRGAYAAVMKNGKVVAEKFDEKACGLDYQDPDVGWKVRLASAGFLDDNKSSIQIGGVERSPNKRGINICVLDEKGLVVESIVFDTCSEPNPSSGSIPVLTRTEKVGLILKKRIEQLKKVWISGKS